MADPRPPKDAPGEPAEPERRAVGNRSQTLPLPQAPGARPAPPAGSPPRSTFSGAVSERPRPPAPQADRPPRSVFQPAPSARPAPPDADKTVKRPYPTAGDHTLLLGGEPLHEPDPPEVERTVRVQRSAFAATILDGQAPPSQDPTRAAPQASTGNTRTPATPGSSPEHSAAEPLRVPSNRPPPSPFQQTRGQRTLLMPGSPAQQDEPTGARARPDKQTPVVPHPAAAIQASRPTPGETAAPARSAPPPTPSRKSAASPEGARPSTPAKRSATAAGATSPGSGQASGTEPLRLALAEHDILPELASSGRPTVPRSRTPLLVAVIGGVVLLAAVLLWLSSRGARPAAAPPTDGVRASAVPATEPTPVAAGPSAPAVQNTAAPVDTAKRAPSAPPPATPAAHAQPKPAAEASAAPSTPTPTAPNVDTAPRARETGTATRTAAPHRHAGPGVPTEARQDIESARAALQALDSEPVIAVKPSAEADKPASDERSSAPPPPPEPPSAEPPPAPGE
jgi:hypothetical protein